MNDRYGNRRVPRLIQKVNEHRRLLANEGTPALQDSWDEIENFIGYFYGVMGKEDNASMPEADK